VKRACLVALASLATFGATTAPVSAGKKDQQPQQVINQTINIYGNSNTVNQSAGQTNAQNQPTINQPTYPPRNEARRVSAEQVNYQEVNQAVDISGDDNYVEQSTRQTNVQNSSEDDKKRGRDDKKRDNRGHGKKGDDRSGRSDRNDKNDKHDKDH
jgi:type IV secretory pathway VirB10-like protein